ncbi:MAG TPA: cell division protein ZapB [Dissulfurispiraceae bacterium]|nr:cell division protein ZapB [Dissulfurispiraceae bacterium]
MNTSAAFSIEQKILQAVEKVRQLKEEKDEMAKRVAALEQTIQVKDAEIARLANERATVKDQIESLLDELDLMSEDGSS